VHIKIVILSAILHHLICQICMSML